MNDSRPEPLGPDPCVRSDPFWGEPPFTWAYVTIGCFTAGFVLAIALIVWGMTA